MFAEPLSRAIHVVRWVALAVVIAIFSGLLSAAFIVSLDWTTDTRETRDWLIFTLPLCGLIVGCSYHYFGRGLERGSNLVIDQVHSQSEWIPFRLTPLIFVGSIISHLGGGSTGREGAAIQLAAGVTDPISKRLRLNPSDRSLMLITAIAAGFGSVFGVPVTGAIFALEVQRVGRVRYDALVPAFVASFVGDAVVRGLGVDHTHFPDIAEVNWTFTIAWQVTIFGLLAGLLALLFVRLTHFIKDQSKKYIAWYPARPFIGGIIVASLIVIFGWRDYSGVSVPLALEAMNGSTDGQWAVKLGLTALTLGTGFVGGEVIPLFVIGALAGAMYANVIGANIALFAIIGSVAVLAGAANTPLACSLLGVELFGGNGLVVFALVCASAYAASGHTGIYHAQKISALKNPDRSATL
jgi:H+/Cl- antiporter ClcA